jgi:hypothetical protein
LLEMVGLAKNVVRPKCMKSAADRRAAVD